MKGWDRGREKELGCVGQVDERKKWDRRLKKGKGINGL